MQGNRLMIYILVFSKLSNDACYICKKIISKFQHFIFNMLIRTTFHTLYHGKKIYCDYFDQDHKYMYL